jgi:thiamine pyrophosphate-dependent acetolactate synthase large subunit-like protein
MMSTTASESPDVVLIGAGIMSAALGTVLKELEPTLEVVMFETLQDCAQESSEAWNNAGTGHAANCELNYTPRRSDGSVDISRALQVNTEFDLSRELWSYLVTKGAFEELNPYKFFDTAALYIGRLVNPGQLRSMVSTAITTAVAERGPVVISLPGDVAASGAPSVSLRVPLPATTIGAASAADLAAMAGLINQAQTVAIFGGDGCEHAQDEVRELAARLKAPVGYSFKGKPWLEHDNPNAVGMTGLLGYGGCHAAINKAGVLLMLGTDFPFSEFLPHQKVKIIQIDRDPANIGRRAPLELGVVGDVAATLRALAPMVADKHGDSSRSGLIS